MAAKTGQISAYALIEDKGSFPTTDGSRFGQISAYALVETSERPPTTDGSRFGQISAYALIAEDGTEPMQSTNIDTSKLSAYALVKDVNTPVPPPNVDTSKLSPYALIRDVNTPAPPLEVATSKLSAYALVEYFNGIKFGADSSFNLQSVTDLSLRLFLSAQANLSLNASAEIASYDGWEFPLFVFNETETIEEIELTFDKAGRPIIFYRIGYNTLKLYWYSPDDAAFVTQPLGLGRNILAGFDLLDDAHNGDAMLFYVRQGKAYMRALHENFEIERPLPIELGGLVLKHTGQRTDNRFQLAYEALVEDSLAPVLPPPTTPPPVVVEPPTQPPVIDGPDVVQPVGPAGAGTVFNGVNTYGTYPVFSNASGSVRIRAWFGELTNPQDWLHLIADSATGYSVRVKSADVQYQSAAGGYPGIYGQLDVENTRFLEILIGDGQLTLSDGTTTTATFDFTNVDPATLVFDRAYWRNGYFEGILQALSIEDLGGSALPMYYTAQGFEGLFPFLGVTLTDFTTMTVHNATHVLPDDPIVPPITPEPTPDPDPDPTPDPTDPPPTPGPAVIDLTQAQVQSQADWDAAFADLYPGARPYTTGTNGDDTGDFVWRGSIWIRAYLAMAETFNDYKYLDWAVELCDHMLYYTDKRRQARGEINVLTDGYGSAPKYFLNNRGIAAPGWRLPYVKDGYNWRIQVLQDGRNLSSIMLVVDFIKSRGISGFDAKIAGYLADAKEIIDSHDTDYSETKQPTVAGSFYYPHVGNDLVTDNGLYSRPLPQNHNLNMAHAMMLCSKWDGGATDYMPRVHKLYQFFEDTVEYSGKYARSRYQHHVSDPSTTYEDLNHGDTNIEFLLAYQQDGGNPDNQLMTALANNLTEVMFLNPRYSEFVDGSGISSSDEQVCAAWHWIHLQAWDDRVVDQAFTMMQDVAPTLSWHGTYLAWANLLRYGLGSIPVPEPDPVPDPDPDPTPDPDPDPTPDPDPDQPPKDEDPIIVQPVEPPPQPVEGYWAYQLTGYASGLQAPSQMIASPKTSRWSVSFWLDRISFNKPTISLFSQCSNENEGSTGAGMFIEVTGPNYDILRVCLGGHVNEIKMITPLREGFWEFSLIHTWGTRININHNNLSAPLIPSQSYGVTVGSSNDVGKFMFGATTAANGNRINSLRGIMRGCKLELIDDATEYNWLMTNKDSGHLQIALDASQMEIFKSDLLILDYREQNWEFLPLPGSGGIAI
ncbi:hypothetical protein [Paraferrimonas sedimenticola]|uniref:Uncharacterized protein n=1 Tax=Paraferrimonas sedimenticola TaxID=375674 RepID=A0AA37RSS2_9GAMM|nr:hypothetical protein [Paraferrimonas sedimenticola]GLP95280.1 hypothetical protein GCM10007895_05860 [Paraferrimonas sedimenticola]